MIIGYTTNRVLSLQQHTSTALAALDTIRTDDPAAADAVTALGLLRNVLANDLLPTLTALGTDDPLGWRRGGVFATFGADAYERWIRSRTPSFDGTKWSHLSTFDLIMLLQFELTRQVEENGIPDLDDPFWTDDFPSLVEEFSHRARTDDGFVDWLVEDADTNPLIGYIVAAGDFNTEVVVAVVNSLVTATPLGPTRDLYRRAPILDLLGDLVLDPDGALDLLITDGLTESLYTWNFDELHPMRIPERLVADLASVALDLPFASGRRIEDAYVALGGFVELGHGRYFDTGFSEEVSVALTERVVGYLPFLLDSFCQGGPFYGKNFDDDRVVELGSHDDVTDFFGALLRDPASFDLLLATIPTLSIASGPDGHDIEDVNDYVDMLISAAKNEEGEEEIQAQRERNRWTLSIGFVSELLDRAFEAGGPAYEPARAALEPLDAGATWLVNRIDVDDTGIDGIEDTANLLLVVGLSAYVLAQATGDTDDDDRADELDGEWDDDAFDEAQRDLDDVQAAMRRGATPEEVRRKILDLRESVERVAGLHAFDDLASTPSPACDPADGAELAG